MSRIVLPPSVGTELKLAVTADLGEHHMSDVDFTCEFFARGGSQSQFINKNEMSYVSDDEYLATVDTDVIGRGEYMMQFTAFIPDPDMPEGNRKEVVTVPTRIRVVA